MQALRPSQDFSFDNDHINEEAVARTKQLYHKLPQANSKQWYENLDGSEIVFHVGAHNNSTSQGLFESASSVHNKFMSETHNLSGMGTIKVRPMNQAFPPQAFTLPTVETRKNQLIFSGDH